MALWLALWLVAGAAAAAEPDVQPVLRFPPRQPSDPVRCFTAPVTRTETAFWGAANRGDAPAAGPFDVELLRVHPDGTRAVLSRETVARLEPGESAVFQYAYPVAFCITPEPRLPWPPGGRFRATVGEGAGRRAIDALDP
jgi:hypothetical protein